MPVLSFVFVFLLLFGGKQEKKTYEEFLREKPMLQAHLDGIKNESFRHHIWRAAEASGLSCKFIDAVITVESGGELVYSQTGVWGPMQVTKAVAASYNLNRNKVCENILSGSLYLRDLINLFEDTTYAIAAYNAGPGAVRLNGPQIAYRYIQKIKAEQKKYETFKEL